MPIIIGLISGFTQIVFLHAKVYGVKKFEDQMRLTYARLFYAKLSLQANLTGVSAMKLFTILFVF